MHSRSTAIHLLNGGEGKRKRSERKANSMTTKKGRSDGERGREQDGGGGVVVVAVVAGYHLRKASGPTFAFMFITAMRAGFASFTGIEGL